MHLVMVFVLLFLQLLSEAANNKLLIHHGDVLNMDVEVLCKDHVQPSPWEQGETPWGIIVLSQ